MDFVRLIEEELARARAAYPDINSLHEGYAVILEEVRELETEVFKKPFRRDPHKVLAELVQIAAMCFRTAEDCHLLADVKERTGS
ncbi:MAG: hypothetical protein ACJ754_06940 [Pyrinomonadaceae bacterium]